MSIKLVVLTGAGISAESGLKTFRGSDGMWEHEKISDVCTPDAFRRNPKKVMDFYNHLRNSLTSIKPNKAHISLAKLEEKLGNEMLLITQNVDDLHEKAGSKRILHMHGDLMKLRCTENPLHQFIFEGIETEKTKCPFCNASTRPDIVFFEEVPLYMNEIQQALIECDEFVYIGTSSVVYPAAGFKAFAHKNGAKVTCLNLEVLKNDPFTDVFIEGLATDIVPNWCESFK